MKKNKGYTSNKGYTLVEMVIVIAIMAVLSGMAFYTYGIVKKAKCNAAIDTFNNQLTSLWIKTKALSQGKVQSNPRTADDSSKYPLCIKVEKNADSTDDIRDGSYVMYLGYDTGAAFTEKEQVAILPEFIEIDYAAGPLVTNHALNKDGTLGTTGTQDTFIIEFNKYDGSVKYGAGAYRFYFDNRMYGSIVLNGVTGNHYKE